MLSWGVRTSIFIYSHILQFIHQLVIHRDAGFGVLRGNSKGLQFQTSYVFSKILTDADAYWPGAAAVDPYNRRLEKSIGQYDITHNLKISAVWDLPFGKGKSMLNVSGQVNWVLGGWRVSGIG